VNGAAARIALARLHQRVGTAGLVGLLLVALALASAVLSIREQRRFETEARSDAAPAPIALVPAAKQAGQLPLRPASDVPLLLSRMQRASVEQGLGWPRADYRLTAASADTPASLEVHCVLKGPYPNIRRFVTTLLQDTPTLTLREFTLSRADAGSSDVEAKLGIVVYLASGPATVFASGGVSP
jgi:hypothetical protein